MQSTASTATSTLDPVEVFRAKAREDGIRNLHVYWPEIHPNNYQTIKNGLGTWTSKGRRFMFLHQLSDDSGLKAMVSLPRTPTWNGWLSRYMGEVDYAIITVPRGNSALMGHHLEGIIKVRPADVQQIDNWFSQRAQTLDELRVTHFGRV